MSTAASYSTACGLAFIAALAEVLVRYHAARSAPAKAPWVWGYLVVNAAAAAAVLTTLRLVGWDDDGNAEGSSGFAQSLTAGLGGLTILRTTLGAYSQSDDDRDPASIVLAILDKADAQVERIRVRRLNRLTSELCEGLTFASIEVALPEACDVAALPGGLDAVDYDKFVDLCVVVAGLESEAVRVRGLVRACLLFFDEGVVRSALVGLGGPSEKPRRLFSRGR